MAPTKSIGVSAMAKKVINSLFFSFIIFQFLKIIHFKILKYNKVENETWVNRRKLASVNGR